MTSTRPSAEIAPYIGVDLTDRYAATIRPIDVCGLYPRGRGKFRAVFYEWHWDAAADWDRPDALRVDAIVKELQSAKCSMIDGPQGLARPARMMRECERLCSAAGRTPWHRPERMMAKRGIHRPFAGFVNSGLDLFQALYAAGLSLSPVGFTGGVNECYPGARQCWRRLAGRKLLAKPTEAGRRERKRICEVLGIQFPPGQLPTHDENDACIGALLAATADGQIPGLELMSFGDAVYLDAGVLREGPIACPGVVDIRLRKRLDQAMTG